MRNPSSLALASVLAIALTACGSQPADDAPAAPDTPDTPETPDIADAAAASDGDAAEVLANMESPASFSTCGVCHSVVEGENGVGPHLAGIVGRAAGSVEGANYTVAMQNSGLTWDEATLLQYLENPNGVVAGSSMPAPGLSADEVREVVDYLKTL